MRLAIAVLASLPAFAQNVEIKSTLCQATEVVLDHEVSERRLVGCGEGFSDNLLWHLDRSDSTFGTLDTKVRRKTTGRGAVIYVLDLGVLRGHDEFARPNGSNVIAGIDAGGPRTIHCAEPELNPCYLPGANIGILFYGHGTGVASVAAGKTVGIAPDASIVAVLVSGPAPLWLDAMKKVIKHAHDPATPNFRTAIVNMSGGTDGIPELDALMRRMVGGVDADGNSDPNGKRFFFSVIAANYDADPGRNQCNPDRTVKIFPGTIAAAVDGIVSVGGIDRTNAYWSGSCRGPLVELAAPAADMFVASIYDEDTYRYKPVFFTSGTSWAAPYVSGMAARLLETDPSLTPAQLEAILEASPSRVDGVPVPILIEQSPSDTGPRRRSVRH